MRHNGRDGGHSCSSAASYQRRSSAARREEHDVLKITSRTVTIQTMVRNPVRKKKDRSGRRNCTERDQPGQMG